MILVKNKHGEQYGLRIYSNGNFQLDFARLENGLNDINVYTTRHFGLTNYIDGNPGACESCKVSDNFFVVEGKEYCALCNELYDTFGYLREELRQEDKIIRDLKSLQKEKEIAKSFVASKQIEERISYLQQQLVDTKNSEARAILKAGYDTSF